MTKKPNFARKKALTVPTLKMVIDTPIYVTIEEIKHKFTKNGEADLLPVATVVNLEDGKRYQLVLGSVLIANLQENYPTENDVFGKSFEITKHNKKTGKDYHTYTIYEIEADEANV